MRQLLIIGLILTAFSSCQIFDREEDTPSFIYIDSIAVIANESGNEGIITSNISDAWVFINDNNMGSWELPAKVPLYTEGTQNLKIVGGIKINGIDEFRAQYPFWDFYEVDNFNFTPGEVIDIQPSVNYYTQSSFVWIEDFESQGLTIDSVNGSHTSINRTSNSELVLTGSHSALIELNDSVTFFKAISDEAFELPTASVPVYLEMDYKSNVDLIVFIKPHNPTSSPEIAVVGLVGKTANNGELLPNKVYVDLAFDVSTNYQAEGYQIGISANLPDDQDAGTIVLDNLKLIHQ